MAIAKYTISKLPLNTIDQVKFWLRKFKELKSVVIFEKTNVGAAIMVIAKSEGVVFDPEIMLEGIAKSVC